MHDVVRAPAQARVPVHGAGIPADSFFPVHRIYCVGRNFAEHTREMGAAAPASAAERGTPTFFLKPADAIVTDGNVAYPPGTRELHHEVELVIAIGKGGANIAESAALDHVWGYAVGVDLTRRDRQVEAKKAGTPWDTAKGFDHSAPISALTCSSITCDGLRPITSRASAS